MERKLLLAILLVLSLCFAPIATGESQDGQQYGLALTGPTWANSVITILVTPPSKESWWNPAYINATLHAISQWNEAISYFAGNYSDFAYLSGLRIEPQVVSESTDKDFTVSISWVHDIENASATCASGLTRTSYASGLVTNCTTTIAALDCYGRVLSEADSQNVVLHELGHVLGLGHANYTGDVMYYAYTLGGSVRSISTLDMYGVAKVFRWIASSQEFDPDNQGTPIYSVSLPSTIAYQDLPISEKNLPPLSPFERLTRLFADFPAVVSSPAFWGVMALFTAAVIAIYAVAKRRAQKRMF